MPELPDVEVLKNRFSVLVGDTITSLQVLFPVIFRMLVKGTPEDILTTQKVHQIWRRGKFLLFKLDDVYAAFNLWHTGRLKLTTEPKKPFACLVIFTFESGNLLQFIDFKKKGKIYITTDLQDIPHYPDLGTEPLSDQFTIKLLSTRLKDSRPVKLVLTDQKNIAGIGNAYADEILFHARINPQKKAHTLTDKEILVLHDSIQDTLKNGIYEIENQLVDTTKEIRTFFSVHGKKGQPCPVCGSKIREIEIARRITHVCPECQKVTLPW
ncbi:MAG: DNA-formamidopyrimidine glycosylase family protein [Candidatus Methanofastidiosia archaeon]|jgi:formamidopyrimidine-DNA glycosylase